MVYTFLKSVLKNQKKTKVPVRYRGTLLFFGGTGTTKVPTVPKKYRGTAHLCLEVTKWRVVIRYAACSFTKRETTNF